MGNDTRGIVDLHTNDNRTYRLHFTVNAMCEVESETGRSFMAFVKHIGQAAEAEDVSLTDLRTLMRAALSEHHPEVDAKRAGEIILDAGGIPSALSKLTEAVKASMPAAKAGSTPRGNGAASRRRSAPTGLVS